MVVPPIINIRPMKAGSAALAPPVGGKSTGVALAPSAGGTLGSGVAVATIGGGVGVGVGVGEGVGD